MACLYSMLLVAEIKMSVVGGRRQGMRRTLEDFEELVYRSFELYCSDSRYSNISKTNFLSRSCI